MTPKRILLTGATGCIGHYIAEAIVQETEHELFLLVRNRDRLKFDYEARPGVTILEADLRAIDRFNDLLKTINVAILAATAWGGSAEVFDINVAKTVRLLELLDPLICEQAIYFSTASILDRDNRLLTEAKQLGTDYIRSKYDCFCRLSRLQLAPKITALFPTLVFGGDENKPYSHLSSGLPGVVKWINLIRWFKAEGSFHFIHARDIAKVVVHLIEHPEAKDFLDEKENVREITKVILGNPSITVNEAIEELCAYFGKKIYFRIPLTDWLANFLIAVFNIQMAAWDRFCFRYRHFTYRHPVHPTTFGLPSYCPTLTDVLKVRGIPSGKSSQTVITEELRASEEE
ncbi:MAG: NAD(P)-dependent oxidoreductase [Oscillatoria sp. PMC 1051.18]|uniref:NAD-dependent epimerase/dehydratase family protein n=1 Tax=Oscillatoria salina TaxID=331517 RepID=UPI0013BB2A0F|nr:NAD(P)-dependent oxidoreductase [Oscillatoria salina]MBZ8182921.1 NAD(P)-dependent oxidoreductase [Oscillatoria salina IIICB1]MEC4892290.1 NAD(P)-dependent oxidoreductase [Oscillatoria sp. PMC 1050.18]MEC5028823.1 NAD(P)-dependent oxidoreductase [Oscillatoria sp. PMC 1051.18]NET86572.1 NAD(P)-dependent oxidoreductase [Kamptonema sp. SIO1D9]